MRTSTVLTNALFAALASAESFHFYTMQVFEERIPSVQYNISFNVGAPDNTEQQGGSAIAGCSFGWVDKAPTNCWKSCKYYASDDPDAQPAPGSEYFARLNSYGSADQFSFDVWQSYRGDYNAPKHNNATVFVQSGTQSGYFCSHGAQTIQCSLGINTNGIDAEENQDLDGLIPTGYPLC